MNTNNTLRKQPSEEDNEQKELFVRYSSKELLLFRNEQTSPLRYYANNCNHC